MKQLILTKELGKVDATAAESWLRVQLATMSNGQYQLSIERIRKRRSNPQNSLMWLWFNAIAHEWSEAADKTITAQDVHDAYCMLYLPKVLPNGVRLPGETKHLSTEQMTEFLERVRADAATTYGITLLSPEDQFFGDWASELQ